MHKIYIPFERNQHYITYTIIPRFAASSSSTMSRPGAVSYLSLSGKGCWVIPSVYRQLPSRGHRCSKPASKPRWAWPENQRIYYHAIAIDFRIIPHLTWQSGRLELEDPVVVLTQAESDARVGALSLDELHALILRLWGLPLVYNLFSSPGHITGHDSVRYAEWLSYFIEYDHCFGVVRAWAAALLRSTPYSLQLPLSEHELDKPNSALHHDTCVCIDGVHTAKWEPPVLGMQGYQIINMRECGKWTRRVWDVRANRVIPWTDSLKSIVPISHSWVAPEDIEYHYTSVNHYLWPVPLPRGVQVEDIREELIQHKIWCAWLDVLCIRQEAWPQLEPARLQNLEAEMRSFPTSCSHSRSYSNKIREERRLKEMEVDLPLIGNIYMLSPKVFVYLNGLGRPFNQNQNWADSRNWLRRAWTLQETKPRENTIIGGLSEGMDLWTCKIDKKGTTLETALRNIAVCHHQPNFTRLFREMKGREADKPQNKIWGLFFPCLFLSLGRGTPTAGESIMLPSYDENHKPEHAWQLLVHALAKNEGPRAEPAGGICAGPIADTLALYLLLTPHPSAEHWFPSWDQINSYPEFSLQESQLDDQKAPSMNVPLSIKWGRIYRRVQLTMDRGAKSGFLAIAPGYTEPICLENINPNSGRSSGLISGQTYTLLDLTPFYSHQVDAVDNGNRTPSRTIQGIRNCRDVFRPICNTSLIIVCRELSEWNPPSPGDSAHLYQYRLRRVTSLTWERRHDEHWLPFKETIRTMLSKEIEPTASPNLPREWCIPNPGKGKPLHVEAVLQ